MNLQITLGANGALVLVLPRGRTLDLGHEPSALAFIRRILMDQAVSKREQRGYIGEFPTQHVIEIWKREAKRAALEEAKEDFKAKGIDLSKLEISL